MEPTPSTGEFFGRYRLERRIGHGGMGVVYEAYDPTLERTVAVKVLHPNLNEAEGYRARFEREAAILARIRSRHIVQVHDVGLQDSTIFLVTEYFPDGDLHQLLRRDGVLPRLAALDLVAQICEGLSDAHTAGVLHRDVKPSNVLLWQREDAVIPYLCDFGIATDGKREVTRTGAVVGSLGYMAPERHLGLPADVRGDVYSVGCVLWAVLSGAAPYTGTDFQIAHGHIHEPIPQLPVRGALDAAINEVLGAALAKDPDARLATAELLRQQVLQVRRRFASDPQGLETAPAPPPPAPATDHTVLRATPTGGTGGTGESGTSLRPAVAPAPAPTPAPAASPARLGSRRWLPVALVGLVLAVVAGVAAAVVATSQGNGKAAPRPSSDPTPSIVPSVSPSVAPSSTPPSSAPPAPRTIRLVRSGTCPPTTFNGRQLGCSTYDIALSGFDAGTQGITIRSCFGTATCVTTAKTVTVAPDGSGTLTDGLRRVYDGYVVTVRSGSAGAATQAP